MDRIIRLEFIELNYESRFPKYILYEADNKYYFNYVFILAMHVFLAAQSFL